MTGYNCHNPVVRLSVCLSVCNAVRCGSQGRCTRINLVPLYQRVSVLLFVRSDTCCRMYLLATKRIEKNESKKTRTWVFWDTQSAMYWSCFALLFTDFVNFGQSRLSGLSLGAFINFTRWIESCAPTVRQLVTKTGLIVCQSASIPYIAGSTIGYHSNSRASLLCFMSSFIAVDTFAATCNVACNMFYVFK